MTCLTFLVAYAAVGLLTAAASAFIFIATIGVMEIVGAVSLFLAVLGSKRQARLDAPRAELLTQSAFHWDGSHHEYRTTKRKAGWV